VHLARCMIYIDMNMVRSGVVKNPEDWSFCGYNEIQHPPNRYGLIDTAKAIALLQMRDLEEFQEARKHWVEQALESENHGRERKWTESIAVGSKGFIEATKERLGIRAKRAQKYLGIMEPMNLENQLPLIRTFFDPENGVLSLENTYFLQK